MSKFSAVKKQHICGNGDLIHLAPLNLHVILATDCDDNTNTQRPDYNITFPWPQ